MELAADAREGERDVGAVDKGDGVHHQCDGDDAGPAGRGGLSGGWSGRDVCGGEGLRGGVHRPRFTQVAPSIATEKERVGWYHGSNGVKFCAGSRASCSRGTRKRGQLVSLWVTLVVRARNDFGA